MYQVVALQHCLMFPSDYLTNDYTSRAAKIVNLSITYCLEAEAFNIYYPEARLEIAIFVSRRHVYFFQG